MSISSRVSKTFCFLAVIILMVFSFKAVQSLRQKNMPHKLTDLSKANLNNPFGVLEFLHWNHSWNNYKYASEQDLKRVISLLQSAQVGWVRLDFLWEDIEPAEGKFDFAKYDSIVKLLKNQGICILGILHYSTNWASSCGDWNCPPADYKIFVNYAERVIQRYKDQVKYWEVWNEPDSATYWKQQDGLKSYCLLLKEVYLAAKKINPDCKILNGGLANGLSSINHLYDNGAKDYFDILNLHFFENPLHGKNTIQAVANFPKLAYKIMARNGDAGKKIWITEIGCPGVNAGSKTNNWWLGENPDERQQAQWVKDVYGELLKNPNVEKIFWAFFRDTKEHWASGVDYFGLVRWDYSAKPSLEAYSECYQKWEKNKSVKLKIK